MDDPRSVVFLVPFSRYSVGRALSFTLVANVGVDRLTGISNARVATRGAQIFRPGEGGGEPYVLLQTVRGISEYSPCHVKPHPFIKLRSITSYTTYLFALEGSQREAKLRTTGILK